MVKTIAEWEIDFKEIGEDEGYSVEQIAEYGQYIQMLKQAQINFEATKQIAEAV